MHLRLRRILQMLLREDRLELDFLQQEGLQRRRLTLWRTF